MSATAPLRCEVAEGVATIVIDRPDKRNAMTAAMWRELPVLLDRLEADPRVRVLVLTGAGGDFCSGADIAELADITSGDLSTAAEEALAAFPKPTLAVVRGFCVGGGCQLAAACDLRLAADDARFGITPAKIGIVYPAAATARLVRLVGPASAKYLLFSAELVDAAHALRIGLVDEVVPAGDLDDRLAAFTATLASRSLLTQQATKDIVNSAAAGRLTQATVDAWVAESRQGTDAAEGIAAFLERRPPNFTWTGPAAHRR
ncbi:enoyl-CoA hydratase/isomerase family protein [Thermomonospora cellulosilytica]|uniref:Enoyl-CoA hydratase/carnithine racemase n=1 Tax=Thermomonospora cellulosilytica TaxID=1411118 RepID=A0A7W3MTV1_9ACTN|nr:enoyl-CoA hydratase/isomerase family protein [Thermomonospora cellulosilytica]MBA9001780.1 enoyl-CoA hydratase/carnithine racemase [Thermomonospora cellulosilytica]